MSTDRAPAGQGQGRPHGTGGPPAEVGAKRVERFLQQLVQPALVRRAQAGQQRLLQSRTEFYVVIEPGPAGHRKAHHDTAAITWVGGTLHQAGSFQLVKQVGHRAGGNCTFVTQRTVRAGAGVKRADDLELFPGQLD